MTDRLPDFLNPLVGTDGKVISGAQLFFYTVGTSIKKNTFSDSAKTIANTNPIVLDSGGRHGDIFMLTNEQYKVVLAPALDTDPPTSPIDTWDNVSPVTASTVGSFPIINATTNRTILSSEKGALVLADASSGALTITLPTVATALAGFPLRVKKVDTSSNIVTVDGAGVETIDGETTFPLLARNDAVLVVASATAWNIASQRYPPDVVQIRVFTI